MKLNEVKPEVLADVMESIIRRVRVPLTCLTVLRQSPEEIEIDLNGHA